MTRPAFPRVSIVVPVHNGAPFIADALESVRAQSYGCWELIVVDDGSTDATVKVVASLGLPLRWLKQPRRGASAARNAGVEAARGRYIAFLDADDLWFPEKLALQVGALEGEPELGLVFADMEEFDPGGSVAPSLLARSAFGDEILRGGAIAGAEAKLLVENFIPTSSVLARRECFSEVGFFDERLTVSEDREMWARIAARYPIRCIPRVLGRKRSHPGGLSRQVEETLRCRIEIWRRAGRNRRAPLRRAALQRLIADAELQLGCRLLEADRASEARRAALESVIRALLALGAREPFLPRYRWRLGLSLVLLAGLSTAMRRRLLGLRRSALRALTSA